MLNNKLIFLPFLLCISLFSAEIDDLHMKEKV